MESIGLLVVELHSWELVSFGHITSSPHAVISANASTYVYDNNGNQTTRTFGNDHFDLVYVAENRLVEVQKNDATIALFTFDGDGTRIMSVMDGEIIRFVGGYYELKGSEITKYYMAGAARVAMRKYTIPQSMMVEYILGDHLGSTSITTDSNGALVSEMRYKPWGVVRYHWVDEDLTTTPAYTLSKFTFTGQYSYMDDPYTQVVTEGFGLMYFNARWMDPSLGRFAQPDSIVPTQTQGTQAWDRYAFVNNNPVRYNDPTGHQIDEGDGGGCTSEADCAVPPTTTCVDGGWCDPDYTTWNNLRLGSPCTACHVTHWTGTIPKEGEIDPDLVSYYRSMDSFAQNFHAFMYTYLAVNTNLAIQLSSFGNTGYIYLTQDDYDAFGSDWGKNQVFITDEVGAQMVREQSSVAGINSLLGTQFPEGSTILEVQIPNIHSYNPQYPLSGNSQFIPGGFTLGGAPERVISPLNILEFFVSVILQ